MRRKSRRFWLTFVAATLLCAGAAAYWYGDQVQQQSREEIYPRDNYTVIEDGLNLGGILEEPPPGTRAVLNVCETKDRCQAEVYQWSPIDDFGPAPNLDWLKRQVDFIETQRGAGLPVYVHCRAGISRSGMVMTAYLMRRDGGSRDETLTRLQAKRSIVSPRPAFMELLLEWEESLK